MTLDISVPPALTPGWAAALAHLESTRASVWRAAVTRGGERLCPAATDVFAALNCNFDEVCVVIVGQDPYPNQHDAIGCAFGVPADTPRLPPTLRNIARELTADIGCDWLSSGRWRSKASDAGSSPHTGGQNSSGSTTKSAVALGEDAADSPTGSTGAPRLAAGSDPGTGTGKSTATRAATSGPHVDATLTQWQRQGVLLLNRVLTCEQGASNAHEHIGWQQFTDGVIDALMKRGRPLVGILWGRQAQQLAPRFTDVPILTSAHPSPLSARRGFFGSRPFSRCNQLLEVQGHPSIHWC